MTTIHGESDVLSSPPHTPVSRACEELLVTQAALLAAGEVKALRLIPLLLERPPEELLQRRRAAFCEWACERSPAGFHVRFTRRLKASKLHPHGRVIDGRFHLLSLSSRSGVIVSSLPSEANRQGPQLLADRAYPLARTPFLNASMLRRLIRNVAGKRQEIAVDATGYDRRSRRGYRRDTKRQPVDQAFAEMTEQGRRVAQITVSFAGNDGSETTRAAFDHRGRVVCYRGDVSELLSGFVVPALEHSRRESASRRLSVSSATDDAKMVRLSFSPETFAGAPDLTDLCDALRRARGLSVTVVHLNPYLQAQVLDFLTGEAAEVVVTDDHTVSVLPRSHNCEAVIHRIATTIHEFFGEVESAEVTPVQVE